jgi:hypothetical protein
MFSNIPFAELATSIHNSQPGSLYMQYESATECECVSSAHMELFAIQGAGTIAVTCPSLILEIIGMYICWEQIILSDIFLNFYRHEHGPLPVTSVSIRNKPKIFSYCY